METIEGNKLIAEFMGGKSVAFTDEFNADYKEGIKVMGSFYPFDKLEYHSSWDWLMPVVEKIEAIQEDMYYYSVVIENNRCQIFQRIGNDKVKSTYKSAATSSEHELKIIAVWQAIVKFLTTKPQPNAK